MPIANRSANQSTRPEGQSALAIDPIDTQSLQEVGIFVNGNHRSGTFLLRDNEAVCATTGQEELEMLPIAEALARYRWLREKYWWRAVTPDTDDVTARIAADQEPRGLFVRVKQGARVSLPCQAAMYVASNDTIQIAHNVMIIEDDAELTMITGCATRHGLTAGRHWAVTESYIGRNAVLTSTMVHSWGKDVIVRPRAGTVVEAGGRYISNYVSLHPGASIESNPKTWLNGVGASASYVSVILGSPGSITDIGGEITLNADDTSAEISQRGVSTGGKIYQRGFLVGNARGRAHVNCAGMLLDSSKEGLITSTPGLKAVSPDATLSHEASIGRIAADQVAYLQARGLTEEDAISMIIRGFLSANIVGLGPELDARIDEIAALASAAAHT